jgi:hypothetical protein
MVEPPGCCGYVSCRLGDCVFGERNSSHAAEKERYAERDSFGLSAFINLCVTG